MAFVKAETSREAYEQLVATGLTEEQAESVIAARKLRNSQGPKPIPEARAEPSNAQLQKRWLQLKQKGYTYTTKTGIFGSGNSEVVMTRLEIKDTEGSRVGRLFVTPDCDPMLMLKATVYKINIYNGDKEDKL